MNPRAVRLPDGRIWLRVADPAWSNPLDPSFAAERGGRWNPPRSHPTLYLNADVVTARRQIERLLSGSPVRPADLDDDAYMLIAATLPRTQNCADAVSPEGLRALGLPDSYPATEEGKAIDRARCQDIGAQVVEQGLRGVWCRSASTPDGTGRELAWFPATRRSQARPQWAEPLTYGQWRSAERWSDLGLEIQPDP